MTWWHIAITYAIGALTVTFIAIIIYLERDK
jgi:hypothetical protein